MNTTLPGTDATRSHSTPEAALEDLLLRLRRAGYRFVSPTPATHERILARAPTCQAVNLRDVFGWSLPFAPDLLDARLLETLAAANALETAQDGKLKCIYRVSSLEDELFLHSAFPTDAKDAVFFGPDSYRFAGFIRRELASCPQRSGARLVDIGTGAGVGGIIAAKLYPRLAIAMTDINPRALRLAGINAAAAGASATFVLGADLRALEGPIDIALANPPYLIDEAGRDYRDGGEMHGAQVACDMARSALGKLGPGGRVVLYTGSAIVDGRDALRETLGVLAQSYGAALRYEEIDPDVFGEELEKAAYRDVERIALVGAVIARPRR